MGTRTVRRVAPLGAGAAVLAVLGGTAYLVRDAAAGDLSPRPLYLTSSVAAESAHAASPAGGFVLDGELPGKGDAPDHARVQRFTTAPTDAAARRLAAALGLRGNPRTVSGARIVTDGQAALRVAGTPAGQWQFVRQGAGSCLGSSAVGGADGSVGCSVGTAPSYAGTTRKDRPGTPQEALGLARPVLRAAGLDPTRARTQDLRPFVTVQVDPVVGDLPTVGAATTVAVDAAGIQSAQGWLGRPLPGDTYPLVTARAAFDRLDRLPRTEISCPATVGGGSGAPVAPEVPYCGGPVTVVGATLGLSLQWEGDRPLLVPSWLFAVKGSDEPLAQVAVDPAYLQPPTTGLPPSAEPTSVPGATGGGEASPGPPVAPTAQPSAASRFETAAQGGTEDTLVVTFTGGVEACVRYQVLTKESSDRVVLFLDEQAATRGPCIDLAKVYERTVRLRSPLRDRHVVDGASGRPLPLRR